MFVTTNEKLRELEIGSEFEFFKQPFSQTIGNLLPDDKILPLSKLDKEFADNKFILLEIINFSFIVENRENAGYQHILLFSQCFLKVFFFFFAEGCQNLVLYGKLTLYHTTISIFSKL